MNSPEDLPPSATPADLLAAEPITHILFQAVTKLESLDNDEHAAALQHESDNMDLPRKKKHFRHFYRNQIYRSDSIQNTDYTAIHI